MSGSPTCKTTGPSRRSACPRWRPSAPRPRPRRRPPPASPLARLCSLPTGPSSRSHRCVFLVSTTRLPRLFAPVFDPNAPFPQVRLGDQILTAQLDGSLGGFSEVIGLPHADEAHVLVAFIRLSTTGMDVKVRWESDSHGVFSFSLSIPLTCFRLCRPPDDPRALGAGWRVRRFCPNTSASTHCCRWPVPSDDQWQGNGHCCGQRAGPGSRIRRHSGRWLDCRQWHCCEPFCRQPPYRRGKDSNKFFLIFIRLPPSTLNPSHFRTPRPGIICTVLSLRCYPRHWAPSSCSAPRRGSGTSLSCFRYRATTLLFIRSTFL